MVHRGFCGVNSRKTSQALSKVVEVDQGVRLPIIFGFGNEIEGRPLIRGGLRLDEFALPIMVVVSATGQHNKTTQFDRSSVGGIFRSKGH